MNSISPWQKNEISEIRVIRDLDQLRGEERLQSGPAVKDFVAGAKGDVDSL